MTRRSVPAAIKWITGALVVITAALFLGGAVGLFSGQRPGNLGAREGRLAPCPGTPNCVSSQAGQNDTVHYIAPFNLAGPAAAGWAALLSVVRDQVRSAIVEENSGYLYAEFSSRLMGYVDDVEFLLDQKSSVIEVRSASRLGSSDFGVNRKRIEAIRAAFAARLAGSSSPGR